MTEVTDADIACFCEIFAMEPRFADPTGDDKRALEVIARHRAEAEARVQSREQRCPVCHTKFQRIADVDAHIEGLKK